MGKEFTDKFGKKHTFLKYRPSGRYNGRNQKEVWIYTYESENKKPIENITIKELATIVNKKINGVISYKSKSGSYYIDLPLDDIKIRISDHYVMRRNPMAMNSREDIDYVKNEFTKSDIQELIDEIKDYKKDNFKKGGKIDTYKDKYNRKYGFKKGQSHSLQEIAKTTGIGMKGIQQIYNKGIGAYKTNPSSVRPNVKSKEQWAYARVYSAVMGGKASKIDKNELKMEKGGKIYNAHILTDDNKMIHRRYLKKITHNEIFNEYKDKDIKVKDSQIHYAKPIDFYDALRKEIKKYVRENMNDDVDSKNIFIKSFQKGNEYIATEIKGDTISGKAFTITPKQLFEITMKNNTKRSYAKGGGLARKGKKEKTFKQKVESDIKKAIELMDKGFVLVENNTALEHKEGGYTKISKRVTNYFDKQEKGKTKMAKGGMMELKNEKIGFKNLAKKVAKNYVNKKVPKKYQDEYGKKYDKSEAMEVGNKVAYKVMMQQKGKFAKGGEIIFTDLSDNTQSRKIWENRKSKNTRQNSFGSFAHKMNKKYIGDYFLYRLSDFDEKFYSHIPLKNGEILARVETDNMVGGEMPLVKINILNGRVYFVVNDADDKNPQFDRASADVVYLSLDNAIKVYEKNNKSLRGGSTYAKGGEIDYFEEYDKLPKDARKIYDKYQDKIIDGDFDYEQSKNFKKEMESVGYTFSYGLDNEPYELRKMAKGGSLQAHALAIGDEILGFNFGEAMVINKGVVYMVDLAKGKRKATKMTIEDAISTFAKGGTTSKFDKDFISLCKG